MSNERKDTVGSSFRCVLEGYVRPSAPDIFGPTNIPQLDEVIASLESDDRVKVVVLDSAIDGFFLTHYDFLAKLEVSANSL